MSLLEVRTVAQSAVKKVTISVPRDLLAYADQKAHQRGSTRSALIAQLIEELRCRELDELAREGYEYYAAESSEFAQASVRAVAEAIADDDSAW
jgi:metal-responsive CopG/Arc/MetJ family transcriptional regulator